jgi:glyoxylate reductase
MPDHEARDPVAQSKPKVVADGPLDSAVHEFLDGRVELLPWDVAVNGSSDPVDAIYTYGHPRVDGAVIDRLPGVKIISNYGVGVDHIRVADAAARGIPVGNTPHVLDGATADMGMTLLLASARRLVEGDRYARSAEFTRHDPGYMLGNEVHGMTLGIVGLGNIGQQVARRARAFDMTVLYYTRRRREEAERELGVQYVSFDDLLGRSDYVMLCCPLTEETRNLINAAAFGKMKRSATLVNIARGGVVDTQALYEALRDGQIARASLDVTEPEPLPRGHPLLGLDNLTIVPHLGSATVETRRKMAENSVINLMRGLRGEPLLFEVKP